MEHCNDRVSDVVAILDAGAQYGKLIDRRIRQLNIKTDMIDLNTSVDEIRRRGYKAVVISGGPGSLTSESSIRCDRQLLSVGVPVLGICYGMHLIVEMCGYKINKMAGKNDGRFVINHLTHSRLFEKVDEKTHVLLTHNDAWFMPQTLRSDAQLKPTAYVVSGDDTIVVAAEIPDIDVYGVQFHPEAQLTDQGEQIFHNFLIDIAKCRPSYTVNNRVMDNVHHIRSVVSPLSRVVVLLSGGIDSAVCASLLVQSVGPQNVYCIHINNGFTRKYESEYVVKRMPEIIYGEGSCTNFIYLNKEEAFLEAKDLETGQMLSECTDPEIKRRIIGDTFIRLTESKLNEIKEQTSGADCWLVQGTLRPDLIESASDLASGSAQCIKTHHNDSPLAREMRSRGLILEPLS